MLNNINPKLLAKKPLRTFGTTAVECEPYYRYIPRNEKIGQTFAEYSSNVEEKWGANSRITNLQNIQGLLFNSYFVQVRERFCILDT